MKTKKNEVRNWPDHEKNWARDCEADDAVEELWKEMNGVRLELWYTWMNESIKWVKIEREEYCDVIIKNVNKKGVKRLQWESEDHEKEKNT
jgi:hypothetical protein